jgi:hypothetical protein
MAGSTAIDLLGLFKTSGSELAVDALCRLATIYENKRPMGKNRNQNYKEQ